MQILNKAAAMTAVALLSAASFAFAAPGHGFRHGRNGALMQVLTDDQKAQAKTIFQQSRQTAQPIRQQLMATRKSLHDAIQSGNTAQIQQLSATEGNEMGQLTAIRSASSAQVFAMLTPDQK